MSETIVVTPSTITWEMIQGWDGKTMKRYMAIPELREAIKDVVIQRSGTEVQELAIRQQADENPPAPVVPTSEVVIATPEPAPVVVAPAEPKKIVVEYQVRDEDGNPLGRVTHLEAATEEEMRDKIIKAHTEAVKFAHRLKKQNVALQQQPKPAQPAAPAGQLSDQELMATLKDLRSDDSQVQLAAHRKLQAADEAKKKAEQEKQEADKAEAKRQVDVSNRFLARHKHNFNPCQANVERFAKYFEDRKLDWTDDNLEIAFSDLEDSLAPVVEQAAPVAPANPAPAPAPTPATPAAATPVVQPAPTATVTPAAPVNPAPAAPRPGVNGGIVPGQQSAPRPVAAPKGLTIEEILSWDGPTMRAKMRSPLRAEIERVTREAQLRRG